MTGRAGVGWELRAALGRSQHHDSCLPRLRRRRTGPPWRRKCGACGTTTGGCRPSRRVRPPACSWPPSSWARPPRTWAEPATPASARLWTCSPLLRSLGAPGPSSGTLPARRRVLALPPPPCGGEVTLTPSLFVNILWRKDCGLQGVKKPLLFVSVRVVHDMTGEGVLPPEVPAKFSGPIRRTGLWDIGSG